MPSLIPLRTVPFHYRCQIMHPRLFTKFVQAFVRKPEGDSGTIRMSLSACRLNNSSVMSFVIIIRRILCAPFNLLRLSSHVVARQAFLPGTIYLDKYRCEITLDRKRTVLGLQSA